MSTQDLPYFKFVQAIIDAGLWAKMSSAARTLYPVLLSFTDRYFSPVYPGSTLLLELTGFKQKSSLRKAREELVQIGLITTAPGNGRTNTVYHFRFDTVPPRGGRKHTPEAAGKPSQGAAPNTSEPAVATTPYNQIHISIHNKPNVTNQSDKVQDTGLTKWDELQQKFGKDEIDRSVTELKLAGLPAEPADVEKLLCRSLSSGGMSPKRAWADIRQYLADRISALSLDQLDQALLREENEMLVFRDSLPEHLKHLLGRVAPQVCFDSDKPMLSLHREIWNQAGGSQ